MSIIDGLIRGAAYGVIGAQKGIAARDELQRKALHEAMVQKLMEAQIAHTNAQAYALQNPAVKAPEPYTLAPGAKRYGVGDKIVAENPVAPPKPERPIALAPGGKLVSPTGEVIAQGNPRANPQQSSAIIQKVAANRQQISVIDRALNEIDEHPSGVGFKGFLPDVILQRTDPKGVNLRADLADIGSLKIHDRSGAAVTVKEMERLKPFLPNGTDDPATVKKKLARLRELIEQETTYLSQTPVRDDEGNEVTPVVPQQSTGPSDRAKAAAARALQRAGR